MVAPAGFARGDYSPCGGCFGQASHYCGVPRSPRLPRFVAVQWACLWSCLVAHHGSRSGNGEGCAPMDWVSFAHLPLRCSVPPYLELHQPRAPSLSPASALSQAVPPFLSHSHAGDPPSVVPHTVQLALFGFVGQSCQSQCDVFVVFAWGTSGENGCS